MSIIGFCAIAAAAVVTGGGGGDPSESGSAPPLAIVVMDPLARPLACACIPGYGQRNYDRLGRHIEAKLGRRVRVRHAEALSKALLVLPDGKAHVIIGPQSVVSADAAEAKLPIRPIAMLSDKDGKTTHTGLIAVGAEDPARRISDLKGYRVIFGPPECEERHASAFAVLRAAGVAIPDRVETKIGGGDAALAMLESDAKPGTAAVIGSHELALLEGCGVLEKGEVRIAGETSPVPFIAAFATGDLDEKEAASIRDALLSIREDADLLRAMESRDGFVAAGGETRRGSESASGWTGWRGPRRDGIAPQLPAKLPEKPRVIWRRAMEGPALAGIAATETHIVVADRDASDIEDIFHCLIAATGEEIWSIRYPAPGNLDFGNTARATPLIVEGKVYFLGAFGNLHCVDLAGGAVAWKMDLAAVFGAKIPRWGYSASPLAAGDKLIVNPGARDASVAALDRRTGAVLWKAPGPEAAYASSIIGTFGGVRQIVGYDAVSLGGWDIESGKRLWTLVPPEKGDYNVPTPIDAGGKLLVATENNGTRLYGFNEGSGAIMPQPIAANDDLAPDTMTPIVLGGRVFGVSGSLACLDLAGGLKTLWTEEDRAFSDYSSLIGAEDRVLATSAGGEIILFDARADRFACISRVKVFGEDADVYAHPAIAGNRLYLRDAESIICIAIEE